MILCVAELGTTLTQVVTPAKNTIVEAMRPHIYRHNFASGSLVLSVYDDVTLVATSTAVPISSIGTGFGYFHGYIRFDINCYLKKDVSYTVQLSATGGYSFAEPAYIGWVNGSDLETYTSATVPVNVLLTPFDLQVWERTAK